MRLELPRMIDRGDGVLIFDWISHEAGITRESYELIHPGHPGINFITKALHCSYGTMDAGERDEFREAYTLEFQILQKVFYRCPLALIPERGVLFPWDTDPEIPQPGELTIPRYIAPHMEFRIRLVGKPLPVTKLRFLPIITGWIDRGVQ